MHQTTLYANLSKRELLPKSLPSVEKEEPRKRIFESTFCIVVISKEQEASRSCAHHQWLCVDWKLKRFIPSLFVLLADWLLPLILDLNLEEIATW